MHRNNVKLLARDEIQRRLVRMTGPRYLKRPDQITRFDLARHFGVDERYLRFHMTGKEEINDFWQVAYSQVFGLIDSGEMVLRYNELGKKTLVRVPKPATPVKKTLRPYIDFENMSLGFDQ